VVIWLNLLVKTNERLNTEMEIRCANCETKNEQTSKYCSNCGYQLPKVEVEVTVEEPSKESLERKEQPKKKLKGKALVGFILGFLLFFGLSQYFFFAPADIDSELAKVASEINKSCPMVVDQEIRLDNTAAFPNRTLQYNYTLVNYEKAELDMNVVESTLFSGILENIKTNPDMKAMRENKITFNYYYKDKKGVFVTKYVVTPDMYKEN